MISTAALAGCGLGAPGTEQAEAALSGQLTDRLNGDKFEIVEFVKTDGQSFQREGVDGYDLQYRSTVGFPGDYRSECVNLGSKYSGLELTIVSSFCESPSSDQSGWSLSPVEAGDTFILEGTVTFMHNEGTWQVIEVDAINRPDE